MQVKDLCNDYFWVMPKTPKYTDGASIPYITSKNLRNGSIDYKDCKYITKDAFDSLSRKRYIQEDDFLVSMIGTIGEVGIVHKTDLPIYGQNMYLLRPNYDIVDKRFLYNFLTSSTVKSKLINIINGATQGYLHDKDIYELKIPEYNMQHQKEISDKLDSLRNTILLKQNELSALDELIKSRFIEMFGDVFKGESKYKLIRIADVVESKIERASKDFKQDDEIQYVDISSIDNKKNIIIGYTKYIKKDAPSRAQQHVKLGDIVISTVRPNLNNVARIPNDYKNIVASSGFCVLRAKNIDADYLFGLVSMQSFADYLALLTTGANYPAVSDKDILNFEIPNAPLDKQKQFSDFIKKIDKSKFIVQQQIKDLQELLDKKMDEYFGE